MLKVTGGLPPGTPAAFEAAFGTGGLVELLEGYGSCSAPGATAAVQGNRLGQAEERQGRRRDFGAAAARTCCRKRGSRRPRCASCGRCASCLAARVLTWLLPTPAKRIVAVQRPSIRAQRLGLGGNPRRYAARGWRAAGGPRPGADQEVVAALDEPETETDQHKRDEHRGQSLRDG